MTACTPKRENGDGEGTPVMPIGPLVTGIQLFMTTVTRTQKNAVVMARTCPLSRRTSLPMRYATVPTRSPAIQKVTQKERPRRRLRMAEA